MVCYDQAIQFDSADKNLWLSKGVALETLGREDEALNCYDMALSLDPDNHFVHVRSGKVLAKLGRHEEAVQSYDKALESVRRRSRCSRRRRTR